MSNLPLLSFPADDDKGGGAHHPSPTPPTLPPPPPPSAAASFLRAAVPFFAGCVAGCTATMIIQPIDTVKVHLQLPSSASAAAGSGMQQKPTPFSVARGLWAAGGGGPSLFYSGIAAALGRQVVYGSARLGLFRTLADGLADRKRAAAGAGAGAGGVGAGKAAALSFAEKLGCGVAAGASSSLLGVPFDLVLVRLQTDRSLPESLRRNYTGAADALARVVREEGVGGLWRGATPTILRAAALNAAMLATADQAKEALAPHTGQGSVATSLLSSLTSGVAASAASLPFDMIKTRLQSQRPDAATGALPYKGFADAARKIVAAEGVPALWTGLGTYTVRIGPHAFFTLLMLDAITPPLRRLAG